MCQRGLTRMRGIAAADESCGRDGVVRRSKWAGLDEAIVVEPGDAVDACDIQRLGVGEWRKD